MTPKMWKITGNGYYFGPFYVEAPNKEMARAHAVDILRAGKKAENTCHYKNASLKNIEEYITSIDPVNLTTTVPVITDGEVWKSFSGPWFVFIKDVCASVKEYEFRHSVNGNTVYSPEQFFRTYPTAVKVFSP